MKFKIFYLINIMIFNFYLNIKSSTKQISYNNATNQSTDNSRPKSHANIPMISENELKEIMQNAVEEYKRLPEEEKDLMSQQIGIKREELDEIMKEASAFVDEINANNKKNDTFTTPETNTFNDTQEKTPIIPQKNKDLKNETKEQISIFEKAIKTLQTLNLKLNDELIREKVIIKCDIAISSIEKTIYYFSLIKQFLLNNENQVLISSTDIGALIKTAQKINALKESIEKLITLNEYEANNNNKNSLFEKYSIKKKSNKDLKNFLENEITILKNEIKEIESEIIEDGQSKKEKSKKIINIEYKIDVLETDLTELETNILENKENSTQFDQYQKLLNEALDKIIKNLKNIFITDNAVIEIEEIIRKYFPEEYKIGKQKEEHIKKQITNEKKIKEQKGSNAELHTEKNIKHFSIDTKSKNDTSEEVNNFNSSSNNNDEYERYNEQEEQSPFDFPKDLGTDKAKDNKNIQEKEKEPKEFNNNNNNNNNNKEKENKKYNDLRHKEKKDAKTNDDNKKYKDEKKGLNKIENKLKDIYFLIENFTKNNTGALYSQWQSESFAKELEKLLTELQTTFTQISSETIKELGKKNIFLSKDNKRELEKKFIEPNINNKAYLNEELEKIQWTETKLTPDFLPQAQLIMYQLKDINETLITTFKKERKERNDLKNIFPLLDNIINEYKNFCIQAIGNTINLPYWLLTKEDIEKKITEKKIIQDKESIKK